MSLMEQIQIGLAQLPSEKQKQVLDFIALLQSHTAMKRPAAALRQHHAFGSWKDRRIDALHYQERLRAEWQ